VRDPLLGLPPPPDVDLVLEGDALALAHFLDQRGLSDHKPVLYPRFGTAMISVEGHPVELVSARAESYEVTSRKPSVRPATLLDDVLRRDFTINTLLQNLHTGEILDLTGLARADLEAKIIRTPLDPETTFHDDPLRMLRAVRFAVRLGFQIVEETWQAIRRNAWRLNLLGPQPPVVSAERIRDEFTKIMLEKDAPRGLEMLREADLLRQFWPELLEMIGVTQNGWHIYDVWKHTMVALEHLPPDASLEVRLGLLLHDVAKPRTRTEDERGVHFYEHPLIGAEMAEEMLRRLHFSNDQIRDVAALVRLHLRLGEARPDWSDAAIKRLIRAIAPYEEELFLLARCDMAAMKPEAPKGDLEALRARMDAIRRQSNVMQITSPLDGREIMEVLDIPPGPLVRQAKDFLMNEVIEGRLVEGDKEAARSLLLRWWSLRGE
jgi:poly(A) polymerase